MIPIIIHTNHFKLEDHVGMQALKLLSISIVQDLLSHILLHSFNIDYCAQMPIVNYSSRPLLNNQVNRVFRIFFCIKLTSGKF
jgi:hypothetical protein